MSKIVRVELNDGLLLASGFIAPASYTCILYLRVPDGWLSGSALLPAKKEAVLENLYGKTWRQGNEDGSRYVVLDNRETLLSAQEEAARVWLQHDPADRDYQYWFYHVIDDNSGSQFQSQKQAQFNQ
jgi:hypothetical protein